MLNKPGPIDIQNWNKLVWSCDYLSVIFLLSLKPIIITEISLRTEPASGQNITVYKAHLICPLNS